MLMETRCRKCGTDCFVNINAQGKGRLQCECGNDEIVYLDEPTTYEELRDIIKYQTA